MRHVLLLSALGVLASCGGSTEAETETETTTTTGGEAERPPLPDVPFKQLTMEQRGRFMAEVVLPEMRTMFQEFDGERFAQFDCATCHGDNAQEVNFHMPNGVAPLDPNNMQQLFTSTNPMPVFMRERVLPRMGQLLRQDLFDPATGEGFSCFRCHERAEPAAAAPAAAPAP